VTPRDVKFRQAAFVYLHVGILYEAGVFAVWRQGLLPDTRGPILLWLLIGALITALVFWGLAYWRNAWFARAIWLMHGARIPGLIERAFFDAGTIPSSFYLVALGVVVVNLWMLARAGWDL
jgi:hypothetical protein